jgi:hypothetical protein
MFAQLRNKRPRLETLGQKADCQLLRQGSAKVHTEAQGDAGSCEEQQPALDIPVVQQPPAQETRCDACVVARVLPRRKEREATWLPRSAGAGDANRPATACPPDSTTRICVVTPHFVCIRAEQLRGETGIGKVREFADAKELRRRSDLRYGLCEEMDKQGKILRQREEVSAPCGEKGCRFMPSAAAMAMKPAGPLTGSALLPENCSCAGLGCAGNGCSALGNGAARQDAHRRDG